MGTAGQAASSQTLFPVRQVSETDNLTLTVDIHRMSTARDSGHIRAGRGTRTAISINDALRQCSSTSFLQRKHRSNFAT